MNIFTTYLRLLKVKHTKSFSGRFFNEHPNKYDLFGLSSMLTDYGIENKGLRLDNKQNKLPLLNAPFIAHAGNDFVIVTKNTPKKIDYIWRDKKISVKVDEFIKTWSGIVLLTESNENSGEPDYLLHRKNEYFKKSAQYLLLFLSFLCVGMIYVSQQLFLNPGLSLSLFINIIGIYVCYLLLLKQMKIEGTYADKICSLLKQGDLYQKKVKQWCTLCLIVQGLLWGIFVVNLCAGFIALPLFDIINLIWAGCIYSIPLLCTVLLVPKFSEIRC